MKIAPIILFMLFSISLHAQEVKTDSVKNLTVNLPDSNPEFPGGIKAFYKHIAVRIQGYKPKQKSRALVYFIVEKDGSVSDVRMVNGLDSETNERLISIIKKTVNWKPAIENGKYVRVAYRLPIVLNN